MTNTVKTAPNSPQKQPRFRSRYISEIQSIMYTCGDVKQPNHDTAQLIEVLLHDTLQRCLRTMALQAIRRQSKTIGGDDLMFMMRRDGPKVARLREYLQWREVRKMSNSNSSQGTPSVGAEEPLLVDDVVGVGVGVDGNSIGTHSTSTSTPNTTTRRLKPRLPWSLSAVIIDHDLYSQSYSHDLDDPTIDFIDNTLADDSRHRLADALTRSMSRAEYLEWTECRQASFTYKKSKKFREWLSPTTVTDYRVNDELLEMFGLLAFMFVEVFTCAGLAQEVHREEESRVGPFAVSVFCGPQAKKALSCEQVKAAYLVLMDRDETLRVLL